MSLIATGIFKTLTQKRQTALGTIAPGGAATGQYMRRVKSTLDLKKTGYKSAEILVSQQRRDFRHGIRSIQGVISSELSVGVAQPFMESICRQVVQVTVSSGALVTVTAGGVVGARATMTVTAANWITLGFNIGDIVSMAGWTTTAVANNTHYMQIISLTATVMTVQTLDNQPIVAKAAGDSVTTVTIGKKTWIPAVGQTRHYYTMEHWFGDIAQSEVFTDVVVSEMAVKLPATGIATVDFTCMGLNVNTGTAQYFTSPTAPPAGNLLVGVNGAVVVNGVAMGLLTSISFNVKGNYSAPGGVVGAFVDPDIFPGSVDVTGTCTILFQDNTVRDLFINETEFLIAVVMTANNTANSPFTSFVFPRVKATDATKDDGEKGISLTVPFTALEQFAAGGTGFPSLDTTISIQDSSFA